VPDDDPPGRAPISAIDQRALDRLRDRLERYGVLPHEYAILDGRPDALVLEQAPDGAGWQLRYWDPDRGPQSTARIYRNAVDAAKVMLGELLYRNEFDDARERYRARRAESAPAG
jgi:hypothetical protein